MTHSIWNYYYYSYFIFLTICQGDTDMIIALIYLCLARLLCEVGPSLYYISTFIIFNITIPTRNIRFFCKLEKFHNYIDDIDKFQIFDNFNDIFMSKCCEVFYINIISFCIVYNVKKQKFCWYYLQNDASFYCSWTINIHKWI